MLVERRGIYIDPFSNLRPALMKGMDVNSVIVATNYFFLNLVLIHNIYRKLDCNLCYIYFLLCLFFLFSSSICFLTYAKIDFLSEYYLKIQEILALGTCGALYLLNYRFDRDGVWYRQQDLKIQEQQLNKQMVTQKTIEKTAEQLDRELEQKVMEKTAALKIANQDLQKNCNLMEKVANFTPNVLYIYDLEKKCNIYHNNFVGEILGYAAAEVEEMNVQLFGKLVHPEDRNLVIQHHQKCLGLKDDDYLELEYRMQDRFGDWHWLHSRVTVFERDGEGKPTQILGITQDITNAIKDRLELTRLNLELAEKVEILEKWREERIKLARMNEFLQACLTIQEAKMVLTELVQPMFPNSHGVIYLMNNSKNFLEAISTWGIAQSGINFEPHECWSLRRGNLHQAGHRVSGLYCKHIDKSCKSPTLCLPMIAKGETLGMLHLRFDSSQTISQLVRELAETVGQNIAMSFANLKLQEKLRHQSLQDPLTGLYNRRYLEESLTKEIDRACRKEQFISLLMLDIDHFKRFNDIYGHSAGDLVLKEVAAYIMHQTRQYDIACRYGGEELVIVMPDASIEDTIARAEQIRKGIKQLKLEHQKQQLEPITVSIGVSCFPEHGDDVNGLINAADRALYEAKELGRDRVQGC
jgi:diguanylate cyclase (GGDEF)-like protein/PAS domain S-box-containing protein